MDTPTDPLSDLRPALEQAPQLPARMQTSIVAFLIRWRHFDAALITLTRLLRARGDLVSLYDAQARVYLGLGQPARAADAMRRRHLLRTSASSQVLHARVWLALGDRTKAEGIAVSLRTTCPDQLQTWDLQAELALAAGDLVAAEAALRMRESLLPESAPTAHGFARLFQARGDLDQAALWARAAVSRAEAAQRRPSLDLLRYLEGLYRETGQAAQAGAIVEQLVEREQQERGELLALLQAALPPPVLTPDAAPSAPSVTAPPAACRSEALVPTDLPLSHDELTSLHQALRDYFPHGAFLPGQAQAIAAVLRGESILAVMPTGGGKSLCYQLASAMLPGPTLVISPLIALMKDQLDGLPPDIARRATSFDHTLDSAEIAARMTGAASGAYRLLYAAPERLRQRPFVHALRNAGVSLLVVDEAHCVSIWGHDFRPDYLFVPSAWRELGRPPLLAMTATATPRVRDDIQSALGRLRLVQVDVHRPNLHLEARCFPNDAAKRAALVASCQQMEGSGIVYATSRRRCEELGELLRQNGVSAIHYHAGLEDRAAQQDRFMSGEARIVVATIAFGMGIDKPDVRFIIHYNPPRSLENYYQEAGRAGRDGQPARCVLWHCSHDWSTLRAWVRKDALQIESLRSVYSAVERRLGRTAPGLIAEPDLERDTGLDETTLRVAVHFLECAGLLRRGFDLPRAATLGLPTLGSSGPGRDLPADDEAALTRLVQAARLRPGQSLSVDLFATASAAGLDPCSVEERLLRWQDLGRLRYRGTGRDWLLDVLEAPSDSAHRVAALLADRQTGEAARIAEIKSYADMCACRHGRISAYFGGRPIQRCSSCDICAVPGPVTPPRRPSRPQARPDVAAAPSLPPARPPAAVKPGRPRRATPRGHARGFDAALFDRLRAWRGELARRTHIAPFLILHDSALAEIAAVRPRSRDELAAIRGIGPRKLEQYGEAILEIVSEAAQPT